ncbi:MAG: hypothetical protein NDI61_13635, partial [Bdellovibrionaceae bacterium]|nr:hypothetical protein [Pseudobdellovibrionaceae bacterium]
VDGWLGLRIETVESELAERGCRARAQSINREHQELWIGLAAKSLLTPYIELRALLARLRLRPNQVVVDLGAAYGRMGFVVERHFAGVEFMGYEYVGERVLEARRCYVRQKLRLARMEHVDLTSPNFRPIPADVYFLYDYGTPKAIEKTLHDLRRIAMSRPFTLVARGTRCMEAITRRHAWLKQISGPMVGGKSAFFSSHLPADRDEDAPDARGVRPCSRVLEDA